jgi:hypothetical protein
VCRPGPATTPAITSLHASESSDLAIGQSGWARKRGLNDEIVILVWLNQTADTLAQDIRSASLSCNRFVYIWSFCLTSYAQKE